MQCVISRDQEKLEESFNLLMETTSKPKVTIPLVAAIPIPYTTIPINFFNGKIDTGAKTNIKLNRTQPYSVVDIQRSGEKKSCSSCNSQQKTTHCQTSANSEQSKANTKVSNMYNGSACPMLLLPFVSAKPPSQIQQKALPNLYNQHPLSLYHPHAKKSDDSSRVI